MLPLRILESGLFVVVQELGGGFSDLLINGVLRLQEGFGVVVYQFLQKCEDVLIREGGVEEVINY